MAKRQTIRKRKSRNRPSQLLSDVQINTSESDYLRQRAIIERSQEKLLVPKKERRKKIPSKARVRWKKTKRLGNRRAVYGMRIRINFIGIRYLPDKQGRFIKHVRFAKHGNWKPKSENQIREKLWDGIRERMERQYKGNIQPFSYSIELLTKDTVNKLRIKPD